VEVLRRLYGILDETEREHYSLLLQPYQIGGEHFVYKVPSEEREIEMNNLAIAYFMSYNGLKEKYKSHPVFQVFERVYEEHFKREKQEDIDAIVLRPKEELGSDTLQSPDDLEATFRNNKVNLVTALSVDTNNTDDSVLLNDKLDQLKEQCPKLKELHLDGGLGSEDIDIKAKKEKIKIIQTAVICCRLSSC